MSCQWLLAWNWIPRWACGSLWNADEVFNITQYWAEFVTRENREWEMGIQNCCRAGGNSNQGEDAAGILEKQAGGTRGTLVAQRILQPRHSQSSWHSEGHSTSMTSFGTKNCSRGDPWTSRSSLPGFLCIQDIFLLCWQDLNCSKEYLVFAHSFTPTPRNILPLIFYFGVF